MHPDLLAKWPTVSALLDDVLDLPAEARAAWLAALPDEYASLKPHLAELLTRAEPDNASITSLTNALPRYPLAEMETGNASPTRAAGDEVGPFRLIRELGTGGMGAVWLADRVQGATRMPVALKLPHVAGASSHIRERFAREREILSALNHPNIARLLEAGVTSDGQPYLALEFIEGATLLNHCRDQALPIPARLKLFLQVLKAVEYAHSNLVIHRDLKPANIIVTATGDIKLLDFGIAKLLTVEATRTAETALTQQAGRVMTPDYASPEQVSGSPLTTASDVYSLGVVLYELLTGTRPYRLKRGSRAELEEAILSADTQPPSSAIIGEEAATGGQPAARWRRMLKGDLDTIILAALQKAPAERYPGVDAFRQDIERYLAGLPIAARPESGWYRVGKFVSRNKFGVGAALAVVLALVVGLTTSLWQARIAVREANRARAVQAFLTELFERNSRFQADAVRSRNKTVREVMVEASERIPETFKDAPELRTELSMTVARLLLDVEEAPRAAALYQAVITSATATGQAGSDLHVEALIGLTGALRQSSKGPEALKARDAVLALLDQRGDKTSLLRARASASAVSFLSRDTKREFALINEALNLYEQRYPDHPEYFDAEIVVAQLYRTQGEWDLADIHFRRAIQTFERVGSKDFVNLGVAYSWSGFCAAREGRIDAAQKSFATGIGLLEKHTGATSMQTRFHRGLYAQNLHVAGRRDDAHAVFRQLDAVANKDKPNPTDFNNAIYQAALLIDEGLPKKAIAVLEPFVPHHIALGKAFYPSGVRFATLLAKAHAVLGNDSAAEEALKRVAQLPQLYSTPAAELVDYKADVSWMRLAARHLPEALAVLKEGEDTINTTLEGYNFGYVQLNIRAAEIAVKGGDFATALTRANLAQRHLAERADAALLPYLAAAAHKVRGDALLGTGDAAAAAVSLDTAVNLMRRLQDPASPWLADALVSSAQAYRKLGQGDRAKALQTEAQRIYARNPALSKAFQRA